MKHNVICLILFFLTLVKPLRAEPWIPESAEVCYRSVYSDDFLPDADIKIKLKLTKAEFDKIVKGMKATIHKKGRKYSDDIGWLSWAGNDGWFDDEKGKKKKKSWDPDSSLSATYVNQSGQSWTLLKYERGFLYYRYLNH